jgi:pimeloyl-ACP methyl ester carboxylesterase
VQIKTFDAGVPIRYADYGGDGPPIVLVHGLGGIHLNWMRLAPSLTRFGHVFALDLPGFGGTPPLPGSTSVASLEGALNRFVDGVAAGPLTLGGNSMGGVLALRIAASRPERVKRLMLFSPAVPHAYFEPVDMGAFLTMGAAMIPFLGPSSVQARPTRLGPVRLVKEMMSFMSYDRRRIPADVIDAHVEDARERMERPWIGRTFTDALRSLSWQLMKRPQFTSMVRKVAAPTIVFAGEKDKLVRLRSIREMTAWNPKFRLCTWPDVGHVSQLEVPERVLEELEPFFAAHPV